MNEKRRRSILAHNSSLFASTDVVSQADVESTGEKISANGDKAKAITLKPSSRYLGGNDATQSSDLNVGELDRGSIVVEIGSFSQTRPSELYLFFEDNVGE